MRPGAGSSPINVPLGVVAFGAVQQLVTDVRERAVSLVAAADAVRLRPEEGDATRADGARATGRSAEKSP